MSLHTDFSYFLIEVLENIIFIYGHKKDVGETSLLIPFVWPSHCPSFEISNSASPRRAVYKRPSPMALREILRFAQHDNTCSA